MSRPCREPTQAGTLALKRIAKGRHPWQKKLQGGGAAPRAIVRVKAAFSKAIGGWRAVGGRVGAGRRSSDRGSSVIDRVSDHGDNSAAVPVTAVGPAAVGGQELGGGGAGLVIDDIVMQEDGWESPGDPCDEDPFGHGGGLDSEEPRGPIGGGKGTIDRGSRSTLSGGDEGAQSSRCQGAAANTVGSFSSVSEVVHRREAAAPTGRQRLEATRERVLARLAKAPSAAQRTRLVEPHDPK